MMCRFTVNLCTRAHAHRHTFFLIIQSALEVLAVTSVTDCPSGIDNPGTIIPLQLQTVIKIHHSSHGVGATDWAG